MFCLKEHVPRGGGHTERQKALETQPGVRRIRYPQISVSHHWLFQHRGRREGEGQTLQRGGKAEKLDPENSHSYLKAQYELVSKCWVGVGLCKLLPGKRDKKISGASGLNLNQKEGDRHEKPVGSLNTQGSHCG